MKIVKCEDGTCKYNENGFCQSNDLTIELGQDNHLKDVNICSTYEDKRDV